MIYSYIVAYLTWLASDPYGMELEAPKSAAAVAIACSTFHPSVLEEADVDEEQKVSIESTPKTQPKVVCENGRCRVVR